MKTKHLFFATALVASLAACTNDDFSFDKQQPVADGRPVVSDVKLNFTGDADTRLAFGKDGYAWEANDTIGALLMDNVNKDNFENAKATWLDKYNLTSFIHTSYPFTYSTADKTWGCNTKMLEGNYFFAFPWESYDGNRQVSHKLTAQEQKGVNKNVVAESYAKNQFFIGYAQIKAGTNAKDALTDVHMTSLLGAVQLRIVNTGTQTYHINKVVLKGDKIKSELTFDPTNAAYVVEGTNFNLTDNKTFNYANYTGNETDLYTYNNTDKYAFVEGEGYDREAALREVVKPVKGDANGKSAQLIITGTPEERALVSTKDNAEAVAYALIMANTEKFKENSNELMLDIYTDEGMVSNINLTKINVASGNDYKAITDSKVAEISPAVSNTIKVQIDDNSFAVPTDMEIFSGEDLLQFIKWNATITGTRTVIARLAKDVTLTKEMMDVLAKKANLNLTITDSKEGTGTYDTELTLATDVPANVLENAQLTIENDIVVLGTVDLTKKNKFKQGITVEEGATLNIKEDEVALKGVVTNKGTLNVEKKITLKNNEGEIENFGVMNVAELADVKEKVVNKKDATLNINGFMIGLDNNKNALVVMGEGANLADVTNNGTIRTAKDAVVAGTNEGEIVYVEGATIAAAGGLISYETTGKSFDEKAFEDNGVNKLILKSGTTKITGDLPINEIEIAESGVVLEVANGKKLTLENLIVKASAATKGTIEAEKVEVKKEATLTNNGTIKANAFENEGVVANNGTVEMSSEGAANALNKTTNWKYNEAVGPTMNTKQVAMDEAVKFWSKKWLSLVDDDTYYKGEPYNVGKFAATFDHWTTGGNPEEIAAAQELAKVYKTGDNENKSFTEIFVKTDGTANVKEFEPAVDAVLTSANLEALKKVIIDAKGGITNVTIGQDATLYSNKTEAYNVLRKFLSNPTNVDGVDDAVIAASAWKLTDEEIENALSKSSTQTDAYAYIWKGCELSEVMDVINLQTDAEWDGLLGTSSNDLNTITGVKVWLKAAYTTEKTSNMAKDAKDVAEKYFKASANWEYSDPQVKALHK